jgi:hypothetical protein
VAANSPITVSCVAEPSRVRKPPQRRKDDDGVSSRAMTLPYDVLGAGPTVVLHAGVADRSMWWNGLPLPGFCAIEPDLARFGEAAIRPRRFLA